MKHGTSILEVLFAILIVSVGLLGSIAVFVVASAQARKASVLQTAVNDGRGAVAMFDAAGMRNPTEWRSWNAGQFQTATWSAGVSICIDSRFVVANTGNLPAAGVFPFESASTPLGPRLLRVGFFGKQILDSMNQPIPITQPMARLMADHFFVLPDDVAYDRPKDNSLPADQLRDLTPAGADAKRQTQGKCSWMATLVPKMDLLNGTSSDQYVLSVVVFHQRPTDFAPLNAENERVATVTWPPQSDGTTGGEVLLSAPTKEQLKLKSNDWLMLGGQTPSGANRFSWYRVSDVDEEQPTATGFERYVTLIGQDWNIDLLMQQAVIVDGVICVVEKTVRLEWDAN